MKEIFGKIVVAKDFKNLPKVQYIAQSGHTARDPTRYIGTFPSSEVQDVVRAGTDDDAFERN